MSRDHRPVLGVRAGPVVERVGQLAGQSFQADRAADRVVARETVRASADTRAAPLKIAAGRGIVVLPAIEVETGLGVVGSAVATAEATVGIGAVVAGIRGELACRMVSRLRSSCTSFEQS